jgi:hypothetical protein
MPTFRSALTALATINVGGVLRNYDIDALPNTIERAQLPALLVLPGSSQALDLEGGEGFRPIAFSGGARAVTYNVNHLLLVSPAVGRGGARSHLPQVVDLIDAYIAALAPNLTLGGELLEPARITVEPAIIPYGGISYHGCTFRHTWVIERA